MPSLPRKTRPARADSIASARGALPGLVCVLAWCAMLAGCAASGPTGPTRSRASHGSTFTERLDHDGFARLGYRLMWTGSAVVSRGDRVEHAAVLGDGVVVLESGNAVSFVQTEDGRTRWSTVLGNALTRFVGVAREGDRVFVSSDVELFILSAQTGDILDKQRLGVVVNTPPVIADGAAFYGSAIGRVLAHDLRTGLSRWQYQLHGSISAPPVVVGGRVGVVSDAGDVIVLDPTAGTATARARAFDGPGGAPAADGDVLAFTSLDQSAYAFRSSGGRPLWRYRTESALDQPLVFVDGLAVFAVPGRGMVALDGITGEDVWTAAGLTGRALGMSDGRVLIWDGRELTAVDDRGETVASVEVPGGARVLMPDPDGVSLYVVSDSGAVSRLVRR